MAPTLERIVVGMDFSSAARDAARWILDRLAPEGRLLLVHAIEMPQPPHFLRLLVPSDDSALESARKGARDRLAEAAAALDEGRVDTALREGRPADRIAEVARDANADLVAVGGHGHRRGVADLLGSTAEQLVRSSDAPVLLARNLPPGMPEVLVVPIDGSVASMSALAWANLLQERSGARVVLLNVISHTLIGHISTVSATSARDEFRVRLLDAAREWIEGQVQGAGLDAGRTDARVVVGDPVAEILAAVEREGSDLTVIGSRGSGGFAGGLGSVARAVLRGTAGPLLIVHADADADPEDTER